MTYNVFGGTFSLIQSILTGTEASCNFFFFSNAIDKYFYLLTYQRIYK